MVNRKAYNEVQAKIDALEKELDELPIVQQFKQSQVDVNDLLQMVASQVSNKVTDLIIESTNGDLLRGETGSKIASKRRKLFLKLTGD